MPRVNEHAFFAFVHAADYLTQGAMLIQREPFYVSITRYFATTSASRSATARSSTPGIATAAASST